METAASIWESPIPESETELLKEVKKLEIISRKNAFSFLQGNYSTRIRGKGMDFHEARKYVFGESVRQIDWNITARMCNPYVRVYNEEREREIYIVLDVSPSMHAGWQERRKIEYAVELAASLAYSVIHNGDRLGFVTYSDRVLEDSYPRKGMPQLMRTLKTFYSRAVAPPDRAAFSDMRQAVHRIQKRGGKRFIIFFISDFMEDDIPEDIRYLQAKHEVVMFHLYDPFEYDPMGDVRIPAFSPEGKARMSKITPGNISSYKELTGKLRDAAGRYNIRFISISTRDKLEKTLTGLFSFMKRG